MVENAPICENTLKNSQLQSRESLNMILQALNLPRDIVASDDHIQQALNLLPSKLKMIPKAHIDKNIARLCIAVSSGLFDCAINYAWNASICQLHRKVETFGFEVLKSLNDSKYDSESIHNIRDSELLDLCLKLNLISSDAHFKLNQCRETRNHCSAAHPNSSEIDESELVNFVSICQRFALTQHDIIGIDWKNFMNAISDKRMDDQEILNWADKIKKTNELQKNLATTALHGIYCDSVKTEEARQNSFDLSYKIKDYFTDKGIESILVQHQKYSETQREKFKKSKEFFTKMSMHSFLDENSKHTIFSKACDNLEVAHNEYNNFYNEPPYAEKLLDLRVNCSVPKTVKYSFVHVIVLCAMGNQYGVSHDALESYEKLIKSFSPQEISIMISLIKKSSSSVYCRYHDYITCKERYIDLLKLVEIGSIPDQDQEFYKKIVDQH